MWWALLFARLKALPIWAYVALGCVLTWAGSSAYCYHMGRAAERSSVRDSLVTRDKQVSDSIERIRKERGAAVAAALIANAKRDSAMATLARTIEASHRVVTVVNATHVTVHDTSSGTSHVVEVAPEITKRLTDDSTAIDSLRSDNADKSKTIGKLRLSLVADTAALKGKDQTIADLSIPPAKPPLLDRLIARVTVPVVKAGIVGGAAYGVVQLAKHFVLKR